MNVPIEKHILYVYSVERISILCFLKAQIVKNIHRLNVIEMKFEGGATSFYFIM